MVNSCSKKALSKSAQKKYKASCYWRKQQDGSVAIACAREEFSKRVSVLSLETTATSNSYSAIIDSKRCMVIK